MIPSYLTLIPRREKLTGIDLDLTKHSLVAAPGDLYTELRIIPMETLLSREINWKNFKSVLHLAEESHFKMCPDVPLADWDVVLSADPTLPVCLLEVNLSRGTFDRAIYFGCVKDCSRKCDWPQGRSRNKRIEVKRIRCCRLDYFLLFARKKTPRNTTSNRWTVTYLRQRRQRFSTGCRSSIN